MSLTKEERAPLGGLSESQEAGTEVKSLTEKVKSDVEKAAKETFQTYEAVRFCTQVVGGVMYFVKVHIGGEKYIHVKLMKTLPLDGTVDFKGYQSNKTKEEAIVFF